VDSTGAIHISSINQTLSDCLQYTTNASGAWVTEIVDPSGGSSPSIALDSSDQVHIAYLDEAYYQKYATNASGAWVTETVEPGLGQGGDISIAVDSSDKVHIGFVPRP